VPREHLLLLLQQLLEALEMSNEHEHPLLLLQQLLLALGYTQVQVLRIVQRRAVEACLVELEASSLASTQLEAPTQLESRLLGSWGWGSVPHDVHHQWVACLACRCCCCFSQPAARVHRPPALLLCRML